MRAWLFPLLCVAWPTAGGAQQLRDGMRHCEGSHISAVVIEQEPPTVVGESAPGWARPFLQLALQHRTTQESAILPFLLLRTGERCTEFRLAESERLLRAQPYLADATISALPDDSGGVRLHVSTVDEVPLVIGGRVSGGRVSGVKYGSSNINGEGMYAAGEWREGFAYRDGFSLDFINHHAFDHPNRFALSLERSPLNSQVAMSLERPLVTAHQRSAWHARASDGSEYATFVRPTGVALALPVDHTRLDFGGAFRLGGEERRVFAGVLGSHQRVDPASSAVVITDTGFAASDDAVLENRYGPVRQTRLAGSVGLRLLSFARVTGFDALGGSQDVARGVDVIGLAGRSLFGSRDGTVLGLELYLGAGGRARFVAGRARWESEQPDGGGWSDAVGSGAVVWYERLSERRMLIASGDFAGAWGARLPYQIPLGRQAGVRGYGDSRVVGARRAIARAEHRWVLGHVTRHAIVGAAGFADLGAVWAGDVPFGRNSGLRAGIGGSLLAGIPPRSGRTLRLDVAVPVVRDRHAGFEVRLSSSAPLRELGRDPSAITAIRSIVPHRP